MACSYSEAGNFTPVGATAKTAQVLTSIAGLRPKIYEFSLGPNDAPNATDTSVVAQLQLFTAAGTTTAVTPTPTDPGFQAAKAIAGSLATIEPTYTAGSLLYGPQGFNQRATYLWKATPGKEPVLAGTAANGAGWLIKSPTYAGQYNVTLAHEE
jgi:hypothetical protein